MLDKIDKIWVGLITGLVIPIICFISYWQFKHSQLSFPMGFIRYLQAGQMFQEVVIACIVVNLIIFYLLLNKKAYDISKGIMYTTFAYVGLVLYISLL
jgi:hypothetical protein